MLTQRFAFFSFMLGWSLIAGRATGIPFPFILIPVLIYVSGWKYTGYFVLINTIMIIPNIINGAAFSVTYLNSLAPTLNSLHNLQTIQNVTVRQQVAQQLLTNMTNGTPIQTVFNSINIDTEYIAPLLHSVDIMLIPLFAIGLYYMVKMYVKAFRGLLKMYRMVKAVTRHGDMIRSSRTTK